MKHTVLKVVFALIVIFFTNYAFAYSRIVILSPDAADVLQKLNCGCVVGKTNHVELFKNAKKVGSHLKPNIELIMSCAPDLIIVKRKNQIPLDKFKNAKIFVYNPQTLEGIMKKISELGKVLLRQKESNELLKTLRKKLLTLKTIKHKPRVVFEVMQTPYIVAGKNSIVCDIIKKAGGICAVKSNRYFVRTTPEIIAVLKPDIYIYEVGPMNRNPTPPQKRKLFRQLKMKVIKVKEKDFLRSDTKSFDDVEFLNRVFYEWSR